MEGGGGEGQEKKQGDTLQLKDKSGLDHSGGNRSCQTGSDSGDALKAECQDVRTLRGEGRESRSTPREVRDLSRWNGSFATY